MNEPRRKHRGIVRSHKVLQSDFIPPLIRPKGKGIQPSARIDIYKLAL